MVGTLESHKWERYGRKIVHRQLRLANLSSTLIGILPGFERLIVIARLTVKTCQEGLPVDAERILLDFLTFSAGSGSHTLSPSKRLVCQAR